MKANIEIRCEGITSIEISFLCAQVFNYTGYYCGFLANELLGSGNLIESFTLTLCRKKRVKGNDAGLVLGFIDGFFVGKSIPAYSVKWKVKK